MKKFSKLLEEIILTPSRNKKIDVMVDYLKTTSDPSRGFTLALISSNLKFNTIKTNELKDIIKSRIDPVLFDLSYDYVGDLAETISLIWPTEKKGKTPKLNFFVEFLSNTNKNKIKDFLTSQLDIASPTERWAIIKLFTGGYRIGLSEKIMKIALAKYGAKELEEIENIWHGLKIPYFELFNWLDGKGTKPKIDHLKTFHPLMLSHPINEITDFKKLVANDFAAEWKWDGIRVQIIISGNNTTIFSRNGENITQSFPDLKSKSNCEVVLDGELLVGKNFEPSSFSDLQKRLNRKKVNKKHLIEYPAFIRLYDILFLNSIDLRKLQFKERRKKLEEWHSQNIQESLDLSEQILFKNWPDLKRQREVNLSKSDIYEGIMLKRKDSFYYNGRPKGMWFKWKRNPKYIDTILMYAQRGHGKRSSFYSDFTFGIWDNENRLVPIGKAYSGFSNQELNKIDKFVRSNTIQKFGPVREVKKKIVFEVAFDSISKSPRHKSGISLRFPRISKIRWDKSINEIDRLAMIKSFYKLD